MTGTVYFRKIGRAPDPIFEIKVVYPNGENENLLLWVDELRDLARQMIQTEGDGVLADILVDL